MFDKMKALALAVVSLLAIYSVNCEVYFEEKFPGDSWESNWVYSEHPGKEFGKFKLTAGKFYNDPEEDKGLQTSEDARFYALSRKFKPFSNADKPLVVQFSVKHEQDIDCGGGYLKVFDCKPDQKVACSYHVGVTTCGLDARQMKMTSLFHECIYFTLYWYGLNYKYVAKQKRWKRNISNWRYGILEVAKAENKFARFKGTVITAARAWGLALRSF